MFPRRWFVNKSCSISNGLHSTVYRAWDLHNGCDVVVKIMVRMIARVDIFRGCSYWLTTALHRNPTPLASKNQTS